MKKLLALALVLMLSMSTIVALADTMGSYLYTVVTTANNAGETDGAYQVDTTSCAVILDDNGVIKSVKFDVAQTKLGFTAAGVATTEVNTIVPSKEEKKEAYGMSRVTTVGEWYQQAAALEAWCVGKTVAEVLAAPLNDGYPADVDLVTGCTMHVTDFLVALEKAAAVAK